LYAWGKLKALINEQNDLHGNGRMATIFREKRKKGEAGLLMKRTGGSIWILRNDFLGSSRQSGQLETRDQRRNSTSDAFIYDKGEDERKSIDLF